jgi:hypothetical protein
MQHYWNFWTLNHSTNDNLKPWSTSDRIKYTVGIVEAANHTSFDNEDCEILNYAFIFICGAFAIIRYSYNMNFYAG